MQTIPESIMCVAIRLERIADHHIFRHVDLSAMSVKILFIINDAASITPSAIQEIVGGTKSNISQRLNYLEKKKYLSRKHNKNTDKRTVSIVLTPLGKKKIAVVNKWLLKTNLSLEKNFTQKELTSHFAFMQKLHTIIDDVEHEKTFTCNHN